MSRRSYAGSSHENRVKSRVSDEELFSYVLRVALLDYVTTPRVIEAQVAHSAAEAAREREAYSRISGAISNSIISLGDMFKESRDGPKSVKFPEKLIKVLEQKLQMIAMGKDPGFSDQLVRRTMGVFYNQFLNNDFKRQMKENRKIEELILMFATHATGVLRKEPTLAGDGWKLELNNQIAQFVRMLRECLRLVGHVSPELTARLDGYAEKLAPQQRSNDSGYDSASTSRDTVSPLSTARVSDMQLVQTVAGLFHIPEHTVQSEVDDLKKDCTDKAALTDLKTCLKNITAGAPFPGRREDFETDAAWQHWKTQETTQLQQLMLAMIMVNPELAKSTPSDGVTPSMQTNNQLRPGSVHSRALDISAGTSSRPPSIANRNSIFGGGGDLDLDVEGDDEIQVGHHFTFIPPSPKKFYKRLVELCLLADLAKMLSPEVDDNEEVSLAILSGPHIKLITECALRWRIGHPYRSACFLDLVREFYGRNEVPMECVPEALQQVQKVVHEMELEKWPLHDSEYIAGVYGGLFNIFLGSLYESMDALPNLKRGEVEPFLQVLEHIRDSGLLDRYNTDISARIGDVQDRIRQVSVHFYEMKMAELQSQPGVNRALPLLLMTDELEKHAKALDKRFPEPILGQLDLVSLVMEAQVPLYITELDSSRKRLMESSMNGPTPDVPIQDIFALYRRTKTILAMYEAYVPQLPLSFALVEFFEPYVRTWLANTDSKTGQWVSAAIAADKFEAEGEEGHSSSIVDLFDSLRSPISFLQDLDWSDEYQHARFYTSVSKTISKAVEAYCRSVEELFMAEMFPRPTDYIQPQKSSAWIEKAKQLAINNEKRIEGFNFLPETCVKLNNVEAARKLLDNMYNQMEADKIADILVQYAPPVPEKVENLRFLFTVKVVIAEGLVPLDSSPSSKLDTFVTLSDEAGNRLAKTRTIYETLNPRWDETFDLSVDKPLWLMVSVRDRALVGKHDTVGRAYLCLDPKRFGDFLTHDLWMDLDSQGRILARISMEGEKDDVQFYFGRAFRSLKRAEGDMLRIFVDKMSPFIQQCLSRSVLKTLNKPTGNTSMDYNKALGNLAGIYRSFGNSASEVQIPLPQDEKPRLRPEALTDGEIEAAISPLFEYLETNLQTLNTYLSDAAKQMVMTRVWKEILTIIEGLLIPPLSDISSSMKPLTDKEVDIVFKWLKFLRDFFYVDGEGPVPLEVLQNQKYRDIMSIRLYYDWHSDALMEECVRLMQQNMRASPTIKKRAKSVYHSKNMGTIKERKKEKKVEEKEANNGETVMRVLRMRPNTSEFIAQQLQIMSAMQAEQEQRAQDIAKRKLSRPSQRGNKAAPPVPPLPSS